MLLPSARWSEAETAAVCLSLLRRAAVMALIIRGQIKFQADISATQALVNSAISLPYAGHYPESIALSPINPHTHTGSQTHVCKLCLRMHPRKSSVMPTLRRGGTAVKQAV